jgi:hypothetical protein
MEFRLSGSLFHEPLLFSRWSSRDTKYETFFMNFFLFSRWNFGYHGDFLTNFFLFSRWNFGYHGASLTNFFLFSRWNFGYHRAFLTNFFLFSRWNFGYHRAFLTNFFLFSRWNFGYHGAFLTNFFLFLRWNSRDIKYETCILGEDSFHIYIGKSIYTGSASLKTLPLDLEPPLQGKEYGPPYSRTTIKT